METPVERSTQQPNARSSPAHREHCPGQIVWQATKYASFKMVGSIQSTFSYRSGIKLTDFQLD